MTDHEWCREFIDRHCILRCAPGKALILAKDGGVNTWQFYMPIAVLNQEFAQRIAHMFWEHFGTERFQICACESGGVPLLSALQAHATVNGVNGFVIKKQAKDYGLKNWLEGRVDPDLPVLLIDDVFGGGKTLTTQANRLAEFGLKLYPEAFCIAACKKRGPLTIKAGEQEITVKTFFGPDDFTKPFPAYLAKYGEAPQFHGTIV